MNYKTNKKNTINILGIDTSNYTTSIAIISCDKSTLEEEIILDSRIKINVKEGNIGIRQSEAHFQHTSNLPELLEKVRKQDIDIISCATTPRRVKGSYMPVFSAGRNFAKTISIMRNIPLIELSHQEGHIWGSQNINELIKSENFIFFHLSGGTSEILEVKDITNINSKVEIIGETLDISVGQLLDRIGSKMGYTFPAGVEIDNLAMSRNFEKSENILKPINIKNYNVNLSGIETEASSKINILSNELIAYSLMNNISTMIEKKIKKICNERNIDKFIIGGGVANSKYLREYLLKSLKDEKISLSFSQFSDDNAIGIARYGGYHFDKKTCKS